MIFEAGGSRASLAESGEPRIRSPNRPGPKELTRVGTMRHKPEAALLVIYSVSSLFSR